MTTLVGPRAIREDTRTYVSLPSRYIEELDNACSPGLVSKQTAFFEQAIRSASSENCSISSRIRKTIDSSKIDESDGTVRTLDFLSDSEESKVLGEIKLEDTSLAEGENVEKVSTVLDVAINLETCGSPLKENKDPDGGRQDQGTFAVQQTKNESTVSTRKKKKTIKDIVPVRRTQRACANNLRSSTSSDVPEKNAVRCVNAAQESSIFQPLALTSERRKTIENKEFNSKRSVEVPILMPRKSQVGQCRELKEYKQVGTTLSSDQPAKEIRLTRKLEENISIKETRASLKATRRRNQEFHLRSGERAEKRKEFYLKLEERSAARELEKNQIKARIQGEKQAEVRKLRMSLTFKANPMPSFYRETSQVQPRNITLKKAPTRAISPRLGRLKSKTIEENHHQHHNTRLCQQQQSPETSSNARPKNKKTPTISATANSSPSSSKSSNKSITSNQSRSGSSSSIEVENTCLIKDAETS